MTETKKFWKAVFRNLSPEDQTQLMGHAQAYARKCWDKFRPGGPNDGYADCAQEAFASLLKSTTACEPPVYGTALSILLTTVKHAVLTVRRRTFTGRKRLNDGTEEGTSNGIQAQERAPSLRHVTLTDNYSLPDQAEALKQEEVELDWEHIALFRRALDIIDAANRKPAKVRERLEALIAKSGGDIEFIRTNRGKPVELNIAAAARALKIKPKALRGLVDKFPELRAILGANTLAEFQALQHLPGHAPSASATYNSSN